MSNNVNKPLVRLDSILANGLDFQQMESWKRDGTFEQIKDLALIILSSPVNEASVSPLKYWNASAFSQTVSHQLNDLGLISDSSQPVPKVDQLLYHALLFLLGTGLSFLEPNRQNRTLTLLSSPSVMRYVCGQDWFQSMKPTLNWDLTQSVIMNLVTTLGKQGAKAYINKTYIKPLIKLLETRPQVLANNFIMSLTESGEEKLELLTELSEDVPDILGESYQRLKEWELGKAIPSAKDFEETYSKVFKVLSPSKFRLLEGRRLPYKVSTLQKGIAVYGLLGSNLPALAPMLMLSPKTGAGDLAVRASCIAGFSAFTADPIFSYVVTELAVKALAPKLDRLPVIQKISKNVQMILNNAIQDVHDQKLSMRKWCYDQGVKRRDLKKVERVSAQYLASLVFAGLNSQQHPFSNSLSSSSFIASLGVAAESMALAKSETFAGEEGYVQTLPYLLACGAVLSALDVVSGGQYRSSLAVLNGVATLPAVLDQVVGGDTYQKKVLGTLYDSLLPNSAAVVGAFTLDRVARKVAKLFPKEGPLSSVRKISSVTATIKYGQLARSVVKKLRQPSTLMIAKLALHTGCEALGAYQAYSCAATISHYAGPEIGAIGAVAKACNNSLVLPCGLAGIAVGHLSESPLYASLAVVGLNILMKHPAVGATAIEVSDQAISTGKNLAGSVFTELSERVERKRNYDVVNLQSDLIGATVLACTGNLVASALVSETVNDALRHPEVQSTSKKVSRFVLGGVLNLACGMVKQACEMNEFFFGLDA